MKICSKLEGPEKTYFTQLAENYYNCNNISHINEIFRNLEDKQIIGIGKNESIIIETENQYIKSTFKIEKINNFEKQKKFIIESFNVCDIVSYLYKNYSVFNYLKNNLKK